MGLTPPNNNIILLIYCWIWFDKILFRIFTSMFMREIGLSFLFFFFGMSLCGLGIRLMLTSKNKLENIATSSLFWKSLYIINIIFLLNVWNDLPVMPYESDVFFVRMFWTTNSVFKTQICDYSCYQFLEWASVVCLSRNLAISSRLLNFFSPKVHISLLSFKYL